MPKIQKIQSREVIDSRGFPTVEADVFLDNGQWASAIVPSGASTGVHEALELRDQDPKRYLGKGVLTAVKNIQEKIAPKLVGQSAEDFVAFEKSLLSLDSSKNKSELGANAILAVSLATAKACAVSEDISFAEWIRNQCLNMNYKAELKLPIPLMNVINGGAHADNGLDVQEFMIVPHGFDRFSEALRAGCETFHHLKKILSDRGLTVSVGDEGGFAPQLKRNEDALSVLLEAIEKAGYKVGDQISLALDVASSEVYKDGQYSFSDPDVGRVKGDGLIAYYKKLVEKYPIVSIEDGLAEDDWPSWIELTEAIGSRVQLVGDDLFVTQVDRLRQGVKLKAANSILIKLNQVGSLYETLETMKLANVSAFKSIVSHRSGETEDVSLAHLAVGTGCGQVKRLSKSIRSTSQVQ